MLSKTAIISRHTEEMERLRSDYEVLLELAVKEKENEMRNTIIENEELEDLAAQVIGGRVSTEGLATLFPEALIDL